VKLTPPPERQWVVAKFSWRRFLDQFHTRGRWSALLVCERRQAGCGFLASCYRELLRIIHDSKPESIAELEQMTGRKVSNLSRTLRTMANYGLVRLEDGSQGRGRRAVKPVAVARSINVSLDIGFGEKPAPRRPVRRQAEQITA